MLLGASWRLSEHDLGAGFIVWFFFFARTLYDLENKAKNEGRTGGGEEKVIKQPACSDKACVCVGGGVCVCVRAQAQVCMCVAAAVGNTA